MRLKKAFTMAEAILVMTILGIIAAVMLTTIKPAEFKEKGLALLAKKVLAQIDTATNQIITNDTKLGEFDALLTVPAAGSTVRNEFSWAADKNSITTTAPDEVLKLYKKYLSTTREKVAATSFCKVGQTHTAAPTYTVGDNAVAYLKDGACVGIVPKTQVASDPFVVFPGETFYETDAGKVSASLVTMGLLLIDTNGDAEPNIPGQDRFILPIYNTGIGYDVPRLADPA